MDEASAHGAHEFGNEMATGLRQAGLALSTLGAVLSGKGAAGSGVAAARGRSYILNSAEVIAKWEGEHPPGDCQ